jgi:hypothetical protein
MKLMKVKLSKHLHWPEDLLGGDYGAAVVRLAPGGIVDLDAPLEREWCKGQEYKLEPAPANSKATPIEHPAALRAIRKAASAKAPAKSEPRSTEGLPSVDKEHVQKAKR